MKNISRRHFIGASSLLGAGSILSPALLGNSDLNPDPFRIRPDNISIAQWALVDEIRAGKWKTTDFPRIAREDFGIGGVEFVNILFDVPVLPYLQEIKKNADNYGVSLVLIMVDNEGETCTPSKEERRQTVINHRKWIDIAQYLGCHAIRTNCRGAADINKEEALKWSAETYNMMLEYAVPANISILIENHGGISDDPDWLVSLMKLVDSRYFGTYPDWRRPGGKVDNYEFLMKTLPYAGGMSFRNQPTEDVTAKMIKLAHDTGYRGWYGIESAGRENVKLSRDLLMKYLPGIK